MLKRITSVATAIVCLCLAFGITASASTQIIGNNFMQSGGWSGAGSVAGDVLSITNTTTAAQGRVNRLSKLDATADWSNSPNAATTAAMEANRHILKTKMSLSQIQEAAITSQLNLIDTSMGYAASTYLVMLKSNADNTYHVYVNDSSNGKTEPALCVKQNVTENTFVSVLVDMLYNAASGWNLTYYIDGVKVGTAQMTTNTPSSATGLRFRVANGSTAGTVAKFAEFSYTAYLLSEGFPQFNVVSSDDTDGVITLGFSTEISNTVLTAVTVNGAPWQHCEIGAGQKSVILTGLPLETLTIAIEGVTDIYGTTITPYENTFDLTPVVEEYIPPVFYQWIPYENFSDWEHTYINWSAGLANTTPSSSVGSIVEENGQKSLKMLTKGAASGMNRINNHAKNDVLNLLTSSDTDYTILIKSRVSAVSYGASSTANEISLAQGVTTKQRLFELTTTSLGAVAPKIHGLDMLPGISLNQWLEVVIIAEVSNGVATFSYDIDGVRYETGYTYNLVANGIDAIQFAQRGYAEGKFDDIEAYLFTGDAPEFSFVSFTAQGSGELTKLDTKKTVQLNVSSEVTKKTITKEGTSSIFSLNGINVPTDRVKIGEDFKSIMILPDGEWNPLTTYVLTVEDALFSDVFSTVFSGLEETVSFTTGGWLISAINGAFSQETLTNGALTVTFDVKNMSEGSVTVKILLARCVGTRDKYMIASFSETGYYVGVNQTVSGLSETITVEEAQNSFVMAFVYQGDTSRPLLKEPLVLQ